MKNKSVLQSILTGLFVVLVLVAPNSIVRAQNCPSETWIDGAGDWFNPNNWSGGCVPLPTTDAYINNGGEAQIHGGPAHATAYSVVLGDNQGDSGSVTIDTDHSAVLDLGEASCRGNIYIGNRGSGTLVLKDSGYIRSRYGYVAAVANLNLPSSSGVVKVEGSGTVWFLYDNPPGCTGAGLFIGGTASNAGGTATLAVSDGATIYVINGADAPGVTVGLSGTLTGNGLLLLTGATSSSKTAQVLGTLAPGRPLTIQGNLDLRAPTANTVCHVTPQAWDSVSVTGTGAGSAMLGGRLTVVMTGTFTPGTSFTLLHAEAGLNETRFPSVSIISLGSGGGFNPVINYDANNVYLYLSPTH